ncbi:hypothetical protein [Halocatena salina]|uniref:DUF3006 domain-containing protein n=1 Tax=Halocatena salina TaxID=2934340 RepID=A0A8U0A0W7_9EURY|nr:hypothetical protein [Halocatena salina]UPM41647.1 hypothetical protein MW046_06500 [Halocatena salina]
MKERRLSYQDHEDGIATLILFENEKIIERFHKDVGELPDDAAIGDQYQPEIEDGELVAMQYDEELTKKKQKEVEDAIQRHREKRLED